MRVIKEDLLANVRNFMKIKNFWMQHIFSDFSNLKCILRSFWKIWEVGECLKKKTQIMPRFITQDIYHKLLSIIFSKIFFCEYLHMGFFLMKVMSKYFSNNFLYNSTLLLMFFMKHYKISSKVCYFIFYHMNILFPLYSPILLAILIDFCF